MKIKEKLSQYRRDFTVIMKCEFCGDEHKLTSGYDDENYYENVIPDMKCSKCKKSTNSEGGTIDKIVPTIPKNVII